ILLAVRWASRPPRRRWNAPFGWNTPRDAKTASRGDPYPTMQRRHRMGAPIRAGGTPPRQPPGRWRYQASPALLRAHRKREGVGYTRKAIQADRNVSGERIPMRTQRWLVLCLILWGVLIAAATSLWVWNNRYRIEARARVLSMPTARLDPRTRWPAPLPPSARRDTE